MAEFRLDRLNRFSENRSSVYCDFVRGLRKGALALGAIIALCTMGVSARTETGSVPTVGPCEKMAVDLALTQTAQKPSSVYKKPNSIYPASVVAIVNFGTVWYGGWSCTTADLVDANFQWIHTDVPLIVTVNVDPVRKIALRLDSSKKPVICRVDIT